MKKAQDYFKQYPGSDACHQTSDGLIFHELGDARLHAQSLKNKHVESFTRGGTKNAQKEIVPEDDIIADDKGTGDSGQESEDSGQESALRQAQGDESQEAEPKKKAESKKDKK